MGEMGLERRKAGTIIFSSELLCAVDNVSEIATAQPHAFNTAWQLDVSSQAGDWIARTVYRFRTGSSHSSELQCNRPKERLQPMQSMRLRRISISSFLFILFIIMSVMCIVSQSVSIMLNTNNVEYCDVISAYLN